VHAPFIHILLTRVCAELRDKARMSNLSTHSSAEFSVIPGFQHTVIPISLR
jgi:hypothetical protein